jgi:hypothetical protein
MGMWIGTFDALSRLMMRPTSLAAEFTGKDDLIVNTANLVGAWQHVLLTYDGSERVLYLNGVEIGRDTIAPNNLDTDSIGLVAIGATGGGGFVDDVRVYRYALNAREAKGLAETGWLQTDMVMARSDAGEANWSASAPADMEGFYELQTRTMDALGNVSTEADEVVTWRGIVDSVAPRLLSFTATPNAGGINYVLTVEDFGLAVDAVTMPAACTQANTTVTPQIYRSPWYLSFAAQATVPAEAAQLNKRTFRLTIQCAAPYAVTNDAFRVCDVAGNCTNAVYTGPNVGAPATATPTATPTATATGTPAATATATATATSTPARPPRPRRPPPHTRRPPRARPLRQPRPRRPPRAHPSRRPPPGRRRPVLPLRPLPPPPAQPVAAATATATATRTPVATATPTPVPTATATHTPVPTATATRTPVPTVTATHTPTDGHGHPHADASGHSPANRNSIGNTGSDGHGDGHLPADGNCVRDGVPNPHPGAVSHAVAHSDANHGAVRRRHGHRCALQRYQQERQPGRGEAGIPGLSVTLTDGLTTARLTRVAVTDANGVYTFADVPAGEYTLSVELPPGQVVVNLPSLTVTVAGAEPVTVPPAPVQTQWALFLPSVQR